MGFLDTINWSIIAPILGIQLILLIVALIDLKKADDVNGPKWMWTCIIVLINIIGPVAYFIVGRRER